MDSFANNLPYRGSRGTLYEGGTRAVSFAFGNILYNGFPKVHAPHTG
mgnify:CR=1 FL=1